MSHLVKKNQKTWKSWFQIFDFRTKFPPRLHSFLVKGFNLMKSLISFHLSLLKKLVNALFSKKWLFQEKNSRKSFERDFSRTKQSTFTRSTFLKSGAHALNVETYFKILQSDFWLVGKLFWKISKKHWLSIPKFLEFHPNIDLYCK